MVQTVISSVDLDRRRVRFNPLLISLGAILVALLTIASQVKPTGTLGSFEPDKTFRTTSGCPIKSFTRAGCCIDDIRSARWDGEVLTVHALTGDFALPLDLSRKQQPRPVPGGSDVLSAAYYQDRLWVPESRHNRLLEINSDGGRRSVVGSSVVGPVRAVVVVSTNPLELLLTTAARPLSEQFQMEQAAPQQSEAKLYVNRTATAPAVLVSVQPDEPSAVTRLDIGDDLSSPTGLALSTRREVAYVVDERANELAWLKVVRQHGPGAAWRSEGKLVRFALETEERGSFRGLVVMPWRGQDLLVGSGPHGLEFYFVNGEHFGTLRTDEQISHVISGESAAGKLLYVVAGRTVWQSVFAN